MKTRLLMLSIMLTVSCSLAADESFKNFRIPDHYLFASGVSANGEYSWNNDDYHYGEGKSSDIYGGAYGVISWLKDSDVLRTRVNLNASVTQSRYEYYFDNTEENTTGEDVRSDPSKSASLSWSGWYYPAAVPAGIYGSASGSISSSKYQSTHTGKWSSAGVDYTHTDEYISEDTYRTASGSCGIVYGRVRDATKVYKVLILEQRLIETGVLSGELTPQTRQTLAGLFYNRKNYASHYERPDRFFWRDIEAALAGDPAFNAQAFDSYSLFRMDESVNGRTWVVRQVGYSIGPVISGRSRFSKRDSADRDFVFYTSPDSSGVDTTLIYEGDSKTFSDDLRIGLEAAWYCPLSLQWQLNFSTEFYRFMQPENDGFTFQTSATAYYEIADRWRGYGGIAHYRDLDDPHPDDPENQYSLASSSWGLELSTRLDYYIESRTSAYVRLDLSKSEYSRSDESRYDRDSNDFRIAFGVAYNFTGFLLSQFSTADYRY